jgi:hypothetical protein
VSAIDVFDGGGRRLAHVAANPGSAHSLLWAQASPNPEKNAMNALKRLLLVTSMLAGLAGCGPDGRIVSDGGGCGAVDAGGTITGLLGGWTHAVEADSCTCSDGNTLTSSMASTGVEAFAAGACPGELVITNDLGCSLDCQISGETVTCGHGTCEYDGVTLETTSDVYTVANGQPLQETATGILTLPTGATCQCTTTNGAFTRVQQ